MPPSTTTSHFLFGLIKIPPASLPLQHTPPFFIFQDLYFDPSRALPLSPAFQFALCPYLLFVFANALIQSLQQSFPGEFPILRLRACVLHRHGNARRNMPEDDLGGGFIHVLAARAGRAFESLFQFRFVETDDRLHYGEDSVDIQCGKSRLFSKINSSARKLKKTVDQFGYKTVENGR